MAYGSFAQVKSAIWEMIFGDDVGDDYDYLTDTDYDDDDDDD